MNEVKVKERRCHKVKRRSFMRQWRGSLNVSAESAHGADTFICRHKNKGKMDAAYSAHRKHDE